MNSILATLIKERKAALDISEREISRQAEVSATTIGRILRGESIDVATIEKICKWLGVSPSSVIDSYASSDVTLSQKISAVLETNTELAEVFRRAMDKIERGEVSASILREIAAYMDYRINFEAAVPDKKSEA